MSGHDTTDRSGIEAELLSIGRDYTREEVEAIAVMRVRKEIGRGAQTIQSLR